MGLIEVERLFSNEINIFVQNIGTYHIFLDQKNQVISLTSPINGPHIFEWDDGIKRWYDHREIFTLEWVLQNDFKQFAD